MKLLTTAAFVLSFGLAVIAQGKLETLASVKKEYLNKEVVISGHVMKLLNEQVLVSWYAGSLHGGQYTADMMHQLPASYNGQSGIVIAIQLHHDVLDSARESDAPHVNALGEAVSDDDTVNPYFDVVVKLNSGVLAITTDYPNTVAYELSLASEHQSMLTELNANLPQVVGRNLYAVAYSHLYQLDSTLEEIEGPQRILKQINTTDIPLLEPLQITAAKYNERYGAVVLKLRLPSGTEALSVTDVSRQSAEAAKKSFLDRIAGFLLAEVPKGLSAEELAAIKKHSLMKGMSKTAVYYSVGFPEKTNDWGNGGTQLVYFSGSLMVYLDNEDQVVDWQALDN